MTQSIGTAFNNKALKIARAVLLTGLATVTLSACNAHSPVQNGKNQTIFEWNEEAHQLQAQDHKRRQQYAKQGKDLQRQYLLQQYHQCKSAAIAGKDTNSTCKGVIKKVEGQTFRY